MKTIFKKIIVAIVRWEARLVLRKYRPKIVTITGSVGKTGTKDAIAAVMSAHFDVRKSQKSFNHELGVPLTILNCDNPWFSLIGWTKVILEGLSLIIFRSPYPKWLVLEVGLERPGDMKRLVEWVTSDISVVTRLPDVPVHVEFFKKPEDLIKEKLLLVKALGADKTAVLNGDDPKIMAVTSELKVGRVISYGFSEGVTIRGSQEHVAYREEGGVQVPDGRMFRVDYDGNTVPFRLPGILAKHQLYGVLAAIAVGVSQNINLVNIAEALTTFETPPGRFKLLPGINETQIIDDTYNSSPEALHQALETLKEIKVKGRKIAVLGDMMELGAHTAEAHRAGGVEAAKVCDLLITVGLRTEYLAEAALEHGLAADQMFHFATADEAKEGIPGMLESGDLVLVKGSQSIRLEKVVEKIMLHPEDKEKLLVRQDANWKKV